MSQNAVQEGGEIMFVQGIWINAHVVKNALNFSCAQFFYQEDIMTYRPKVL